MHVDYHDKRAWELMLRVGEDLKPTKIVFLGDFADFYSISFFSKDPSRNDLLQEEVDAVNREFTKVDKLFPATDKIFIAGNHEHRLERFIWDKAPQLYGMVTIKSLFQFDRRKWSFIEYGDHIKIGKLIFTHAGAEGKNAAYKAIAKYEHSVMFGHLHRIETAIKVAPITGESHIGIIPGWGGDIKTAAPYIREKFADWMLGFATVVMDEGLFFPQVHPIVNYRVYVNGRIYRG